FKQGVLRNGQVAVKRIKNNHTIDEKVFQREVNSLFHVSHKNIVRFLGFCSHTEHKAIENEGSRAYIYAENRERILCFEYINNGSLENYITDELRGLQWDTRYFIIKGICDGLQYLHVEKQIIHMDLKPANILIDHNMVAKITDFGLSRMEENAQTKSTTRVSSPGYTAPEYIDKGKMSVKYDVYSLGIIIIELVTGHRSIPDSNNVRRRWRHRLHKSGKETLFRCQQIEKLIEIGLLCQQDDPYKRPFISDIIRVINELESTDSKISNTNEKSRISNPNESTIGQISPYLEDDMLGIEPLELCFPFELNSQISCSLKLTNETNDFIAFNVETTSPLPYCIQPNKGFVAPRSKFGVNITLQPLDKAPQDKYTGDFIVRSTRVNENLDDITEDIFKREEGKLVDEVNLTITYKAEEPQVDVPLGSPIISDTGILHGPHVSTVLSTEAESKISASSSDEVIQFDPPELCFPLVPDKKVLSSVKIINITDLYVSIAWSSPEENSAMYAVTSSLLIMPPRSTRWLTVTREEKEDAVKDMQFNDQVFVWYTMVAEDIKVSDLDSEDYKEYKKLPVVLTKIKDSCTTSTELIQFDPPELGFPCLNKTSLSSLNMVNITDCYVGFNSWSFMGIDAWYTEPCRGILPPRSTQRMLVQCVPKENEAEEDMQCKKSIFLWNMIVAQGVESSCLIDQLSDEDSKELPVIFNNKISSPFTSASGDKLIRLDHPAGLAFPQNKTGLSSINIVNVTNYYVGFRLFSKPGKDAAVTYHMFTEIGILAPRSDQRLAVARLTNEKETQDTTYNDDKLFIWNSIVSEGIKVSDLDGYISLQIEQSIELPLIFDKITSSTSVEVIKFEPPQVCFPFLPSKRLLSSIKIVNITDYHIGFNTQVDETNVALYITEPPCGILPPGSTRELVVTRVAKEDAPELEDMQCKDKYFVWSCVVTQDVNVSDLIRYMPEKERKELPIVFMETSSNELIQFDPPELSFPLLPNQRVLSSTKIVNITDQYISFRVCTKKSNSARYNANPSEGILPPLSTQVILVTRIAEEKELEGTQCNGKFLVWNGIVTEDAKASDVIDNMSETKCTGFLILLKQQTSSSISEELIQFDPPELHFPILPNKKVLSSIKIVNLTDYNVGFNTYNRPTSVAWYHTEPPRGILPPRSTQKLMVTREEKEDALKYKQLNEKYSVWTGIVSECVKDSELSDCMAEQESKELPIVLDKISSLTSSDELIQLDPAELCMPHWPNKEIKFMVNVVNTTDFYVAFNVYIIRRNAARDKIPAAGELKGILPPRSTKIGRLNWRIDETEEPVEDYFVWSRVVTEGVKSIDITGYMVEEESKQLPFIVNNKASLSTSKELIQFEPPELSLPLMMMPNKPLVFSVNIVNSTDYYVGFDGYNLKTNVAWYFTQPTGGIMPPRSTQRLVVKRVPKKKEELLSECQDDKFLVWSCLVSDGAKAKASDLDLAGYGKYKGSKELPIVYTNKTSSLCTSDELIQFDPPQLPFTFLPNMRVSMLRLLKIVNVTDHIVGFSAWPHEENSASYTIEPDAGILQPQSTQAIKVRRTPRKKDTEDIQCKDRIFVWNGIVTQGVQVSDVGTYWKNEDKELPIVLTKPGESSSR
uniref:non-specific serine/threonine protein kinase n=1 Tax=Aegilops tauschii subsp. strangulata TaxID=200361 RepID=A0A453GYH8_AEGTS